MPNKPREYDPENEQPLRDISTDIKIVGYTSFSGARHFVTFVDRCTRFVAVYFIEKKSDVAEAWNQYLAWSVRQGFVVKTVSVDGGGEFWSTKTADGQLINEHDLAAFEYVCKHNPTGREIEVVRTPGSGHSDMNPLAERYHKKITDLSNAMLYHARLGPSFWEWAVRKIPPKISRRKTSILV